MDNIVYGNSVHNGLPFEFWTKFPHSNPPLPLRVAWQPSRMWQVEVFQAERGVTLPLPMQNWFWLVTQRQAHKMCYSSVDRPGEQRAGPRPTLMPSPMAADATWRPQSLQPARRRRRAPAGSPKPMSMSCTEKAFSAGRQAGSLPSSPVPLPWRQSVTARLHVLCVD